MFDVREDVVHYNNSIDMCLVMLKDDWIESARTLKQRAETCLKAGDLANCSKDIEKARSILEEK